MASSQIYWTLDQRLVFAGYCTPSSTPDPYLAHQAATREGGGVLGGPVKLYWSP